MKFSQLLRSFSFGVIATSVFLFVGCFSNDPEETPPGEEPVFASEWTWRNPLPHGHNLGTIISNDSVRVIFTEAGIMRSVHGGAWKIHEVSFGLTSAVWTGSKFIGVGSNLFATSTDGLSWTVQRLPSDTVHLFDDIVWTGSLAVAVGWGYPEAAIFTSPDGLVWTERSSVGAVSLHAIAWTGSLFAAVGSAGELRTSPDGINWTARPKVADNGLFDIVWTGTKLVAVGGDQGTIRTSPDGITWASHTPAETNDHASFTSIVWTGTKVVAAKNNGKILTSPDGINWTLNNTVPFWINHLAWTGTEVLAVGEGGAMFSSPDGVNWVSHVSGSRAHLSDVAWNGEMFVAVGLEGVVLTSPDGVSWIEREAGNGDLNAVTWTGSLWVAVGQGGVIATSENGTMWTTRISGVTAGLRDVEGTGALLVAVGDNGTVLTSADGVTWSAQASGTTEYLSSLLWDGSRWLAVGNRGVLLSSLDGVTWATRIVDSTEKVIPSLRGGYLSSIVWTGNRYVITVPGGDLMGSGYLLQSIDGETWIHSAASLARVFWLNGYLVGIDAGSDTPTEATIRVSDTGNTWRSIGLNTANSISSIAWGYGKLVAVGFRGTIFSSP